VIILHMDVITWDVVHRKLWLKIYLHHEFVANLICGKLNKLMNSTIAAHLRLELR
jgi:hypothetical protein